MISVLSIVHDTMVDGPGFRTSIYCAGCPNHCPECHNPQSWDINHGTMTSTEEIMKEIMDDPFANVTFSGGDPMFQAEGFAELARAIRAQSDKDIWCFTGYKFENLLKNPKQLELLKLIDVLVDGPFMKDLRDEDLFFRGSSNQRLINVKKSLETGKVIELHLTKEIRFRNYKPLPGIINSFPKSSILSGITQFFRPLSFKNLLKLSPRKLPIAEAGS